MADIAAKECASVTAALLHADRKSLPLYILICSLPSVLGLLLNLRSPYQKLSLFFIEHLICLGVLYLIALRAKRIISSDSRFQPQELARLLGFGICFTLVFALPLSLLMGAGTLVAALIALLILVAVAYKLSVYFFYPLPFLFGRTLQADTLSHIRRIVEDSRWAWAKALAVGYGPPLLITALIRAFAPADNRAILSIISQAVGGQFELHGLGWVLLCYIRIGQGLLHAAPQGLSKLSRAPVTLEKNLSGFMGALFVAIGVLLSVGNFFQSFKIPPHETFAVLHAEKKEGEITIRVKVADSENSFFSFSPLRLSLTDSAEQRTNLLSPFPYHAMVDSSDQDVRYNFPRGDQPQDLTLNFVTFGDPQKIPPTLTLRYRGLPVAQVTF